MYLIIDDSGIIHSFTDYDETMLAWEIMTDDGFESDEREKYDCDFSGDLRLVKQLKILA